MPPSTPYQNNFTGGEVSPQMIARFDFDKLYNSCSELENMFVIPQGGASRRPGTRYVASTKYANRRALLVPFRFSTTQAYVLEFGHQYIRVFKDRGQVISNAGAETVTNGNFDNDISGWTASTSPYPTSATWDGTYKCIKIAYPSNSSGYGAYAYQNITIPAGTYRISGSLINKTSNLEGLYSPYISVIACDSSFNPVSVIKKIETIMPGNYSDSFFVSSTTNIRISLGFPSVSGPGTYCEFDYISLTAATTASPVEIPTGFTEDQLRKLGFAQSADELYITNSLNQPTKLTRVSHTSWQLTVISFTAQPSDWTINNYPSSVSFFEQRLCFSGVPTKPRTVYCSKAGSFFDFTIPSSPTATDPVIATFTDNEVNAIQWMYPYVVSSVGKLLIGTSSGTGSFGSNSLGDVLTPSNPKFSNESAARAGTLPPKRVNGSLISTDYYDRHVISTTRDSNGNLITDSLMLLAEHLTSGGRKIIDYALMSAPTQILWCVLDDGTIIALTYLPDQQVYAWHRHSTRGSFESVCVIPSSAGSDDEVWCIVRRTVNGSDARFVEYIMPQFDINNSYTIDSAVNVDCSLSGSFATPVTQITYDIMGNDVTVTGTADGKVFNKTVSAGKITLDTPASNVTVGLPYTSTLTPVPRTGGSVLNVSEGKLKRVNEMSLRLFNTGEFKAGRPDKLYTRYANSKTAELYTGIHRFADFPGDWSMEASVTVKQDKPLPLTILSIIPSMNTNERA